MKITNLCNITKNDNYWSKANNLWYASNIWYNIPRWFVIDLWDDDIDEELIYNEISNIQSKTFAVRSSCNIEDGKLYSFAWQFDTFLFVSKENIVEKIKECADWINNIKLKSYQNIVDYKVNNINLKMFIIVQEMIVWEYSWVCFSKNPVNLENEIIIEWNIWICENIVNWKELWFKYVYNSNNYLFPKSIINHNFIIWLIQIVKNLKNIVWYDVDLEWTYISWKIYILQFRPITKNIIKKDFFLNSKWIDEYTRMFESENRPFIFSDIYMWYYSKLKIVLYFDWIIWKTYIPNDMKSNLLLKWKELYENKQNVLMFKNDFKNFITDSEKYLEDKMDNYINLKITDVEKIYKIFINFFKYYSKTEFFYTDSLNTSYVLDKKIWNIKNPWRKFFSKLFFWNNSYLNKVLNKISVQYKIDKLLLWHLSFSEILLIIKNQKYLDLDIINKRKSWYIFWLLWNKYKLIEWKTALDFIKNIQQKKLLNLNWTIASYWFITWIVKIIKPDFLKFDYLYKGINWMVDNSILVVESATPDLILACKKAWWIITNQGWILSHAWIFCREIGIPCLVSTENATSILNDWDEIILNCTDIKTWCWKILLINKKIW